MWSSFPSRQWWSSVAGDIYRFANNFLTKIRKRAQIGMLCSILQRFSGMGMNTSTADSAPCSSGVKLLRSPVHDSLDNIVQCARQRLFHRIAVPMAAVCEGIEFLRLIRLAEGQLRERDVDRGIINAMEQDNGPGGYAGDVVVRVDREQEWVAGDVKSRGADANGPLQPRFHGSSDDCISPAHALADDGNALLVHSLHCPQ